MKTVEQLMNLAAYYAECRVGTHIRPTSEKEYRDLDVAAKELRTAIEELAADAARYRTVLGMPSDVLLRLYNTRFDLRQQVIDAAMEST